MRMYDIILKKRKGQELSAEEIRFVINDLQKAKYPTIKCLHCSWLSALIL